MSARTAKTARNEGAQDWAHRYRERLGLTASADARLSLLGDCHSCE